MHDVVLGHTSISLRFAALVVVLLALPSAPVRAQNLAPELINSGPLLAARGTSGVITSDQLLARDPDSAAAVNYRIVSTPAVGSLLLDGVALGDGAQFDQDAIDDSRVAYFAPQAPAQLDDAFEFVADDGAGGELGSNAAPLRFPIRIANQPPTVSVTEFSTPEDQPLLANLAAADADGDAVTCALSSPPARGQVELAAVAPCAFTYTPNPDATGIDLFYFRVVDTFHALSSISRARITVTPVNDPPTALPTPLKVKLNTAQDGTLLASDPDGDPLRFTIQNAPALGSVEIVNASSGRFRYTPRTNVSGADSFSFAVIEAQVQGSVASTATVTVTIAASANRAPIVEPGFIAVREDESYDGFLVASDADGDTLTFELDAARMAQKGAVQVANETTGAFTYIPDLNATGADLFFFRVGDGSVLSEPVRVDIDIRAVNDAPLIAGLPPLTLDSGQVLDFQPVISDPDGDPLQITITGCPQWASCDADSGHIGGRPAADGSDAGAGAPILIEVSDGRISSALGPFTIDVLGVVPVSRATPAGGAFNTPQFVQLHCQVPEAAGPCETFYSTDAEAEVGDFVRYDDTPIAIAETATLRYFSQLPGTAEPIQSADFVIDQTPPALTIIEPAAARLDAFPNVSGTASDADTGVQAVTVRITDGIHYVTQTDRGPEVTPVPSSMQIPLQASGDWQLALPQRNWPPGQWSVTAEVADGAGNRVSRSVLFDFVDETASAFTRLSIFASSPTVLPGGELSIRGQLSRLPDTGVSMAGRALTVQVRGPEGSSLSIQDLSTDDDAGRFTVDLRGLLTLPGRHEVQVDFAGTTRLDPSNAQLAVLVGESAGYAIIVHGRDADEEGLLSHNLTTQRVYATLKSRGLEDENIRYLSHVPGNEGFDGTPSSTLLMASITQWARDRLNGAPAPLFFVFVGHAGPAQLLIDGADTVHPTDLKLWLEALEGGLTDDALRAPRILVLGGCYTESFIAELSAPGRVLIASAGSDEESYRGPLEDFDAASGEAIRSGELFVELLFKRLALDQPLPLAYEQARSLMEIFTQRGGVANATRYFDNAAQHPFFDDNADGEGTNRISPGSGDGVASAEVHLGIAAAAGGVTFAEDARARFVRVTPTLRLGEGRDQADLFVVAHDPSRVAAAWAEIRSPSVILQGQGGTIQLDNVLTKVLLLPQNGRFQARCTVTDENARQRGCFGVPGRYEVYYFARDTLTDTVSALQRSLVYVDRPGNRPPQRFTLVGPIDGATLAPSIVLDWTDAVDADGDSAVVYNVEVARDPEFTDVLLRRDGLSSSALALGRQTGLIRGQSYHWRVTAVDPFGATRESDTASFTVADDAERGVLRGVVYAQASSRAVANARVTVGGHSSDTGADGRFLLALPAGAATLLVEALGFNPATIAGTTVVAGAEQSLAVPLDANDLSVVSQSLDTDEDGDVGGKLQGASAGAAIEFELASLPQHGTLAGALNAATGTFTYRPDPDFNGSDQFRFNVRDATGRRSSTATVTIVVRPRNDAPVLQSATPVPALPRLTLGVGDPTGIRVSTLLEGRVEDVDGVGARGIAVTWRDSSLGDWQYSLDGGVQWHSIPLSSPAAATLLGSGPASRVRFVPFAAGSAQLEFRAWDQSAGTIAHSGVDTRINGGSSAFSSALARTTVTVDASSSFPVALAGAFTVPRGDAHFGALRASGAVGDANRRFRIVSLPRKGRLRLLNALTGQFRYTADPDRTGSDSFGFAVHGAAFQSNTAAISVEITAVNRAPSVADGAFSTRFDRALDIRIGAADADGDPLSYQLAPIGFPGLVCGTLTPAPAGLLPEPPILTYTPNVAGACDENPVQLTVSDGIEDASATLTISVTDLVAQPPLANAASFTTAEDQGFRSALSGSDPQGAPLVFELLSGAAKGQVTLLHPVTGRFSYTPNLDANGQDSFEFRVRNADGAPSAPATVVIDITPIGDAPRISGTPPPAIAAGEAYAFTPDAVDPDGEPLAFGFENCPLWAACDTATGTISGVPGSEHVGVFRNVRITASDGGRIAALRGFDIAVLPDSGAAEIVRSTTDGAYNDAQHVALTCHDSAGGSCEIFYTLDDPAIPPMFTASSALRAGAGMQIRGEVIGASTGVSTSGSYALSHVVGQAGAVGIAQSRHYRLSAGAVSADSDGDGTPDIHDLFPTDPSAYLRYTAPVEVDESAILRFFSRDEAGNIGQVASASYIIDRTAPQITITAPGVAATTERILWIGGTVADPGGTGVAELTVEIKDENQYLGPDGVSGTPTRLPVGIEDGGQWLLFTGTVPWELDTVYSITARARDRAGNESVVSRLVQLSDNPVQRPTRLSLELSARRVLVDDSFAVAGKLTRLPDSGLSLAGRPIEITVLEPDGSLLFATSTHTRDELGNYRLQDLGGFVATGAHRVIARFRDTALLAASEATASLQVASAPGLAILVQGKRAGAAPNPAHGLALERLRTVLLNRGIGDADINYLAYGTAAGIDGQPSRTSVENAIRQWARGRLLAAPAPLLIALVGYGESERFALDAAALAPRDLAAWLSALEASLPAATLTESRTVLLAANRSGSFLPSLSAPGRIVITSTSADGSAYQSSAEPNGPRTASLFVNELAIGLAEGRSLATAFNTAGAALRRATRAGGDSEHADGPRQQPRLDDNGDGEGSEVLADFGLDGQLAAQSILGIGRPVIRLGVAGVTDTLSLADGQSSADLWTRLGDGTPLGEPWITIRAPSDRVLPANTDLQGILPFERVALPDFNAARQRWELRYDGFDEPGLYEIAYQVLDARDGSLSAAARSLVYRDTPGNQAPGAFALLTPGDGDFTSTAPAFSWTASADPDGDAVTYTLEIAEENTFSNPVHRQERLSVTATTVTAAAGLRDLSTYFWRVLAVDRWGAVQVSETFQFSTDNSNGTPVLLRITSKDASTGELLGSVDLRVDGQNAGGDAITLFVQTTATGLFSTQLGVGAVTVTASKDGYDAAPQTFRLSELGAIVDVLLTPRPSVDLVVALDYQPAWPRVGESIDYSVRITNQGPETATGIIVASDLVGTDFTVNAAPGCNSTTLPLVCNAADLPPAASMTLTISATPNLASGAAQHVVNATANEADANPADNEGVILSVAVADADDDGNPDETDPLPGTANVLMTLRAGLNLRSLPVLPANVVTASDLLDALGSNALRVERLNAASGSWQVFDRVAGGTDFVLVPGEGYALTMQAAVEMDLIGNPVSRSMDLAAGANLIGVLVETGGDAFGLMTRLGGNAVVAAVADFDLESGRYRTAGFDKEGRPVGSNFPVQRGRAYYIMLRSPVSGFELR